MYFTFECEACGKALKVREEIAGRNARCPYCQATVTVPDPPDPEPDPLSGIAASNDALASRRPVRGRSGKSAAMNPDDGTNVSLVQSGLIGLGLTVVFLALMLMIKDYYLGDLFLHRGWVPFVLVFLMAWSAAILMSKGRKLKRQKEAMLFDVLPSQLSAEITLDTLDEFTGHVRSLPGAASGSFLVNRVLRGLEHFRVRGSATEVASMMSSQSEIDATSVESSYTLLKVFIWAIPILGFIGTVIGISDAVGGFSGTLESGEDMDAIRASLNDVTSGLATAFDTTLVALIFSLLVMFPTSSMQKAEEDLLNWVDEYCNENLIKRLQDGGRRGQPVSSQEQMQAAIHEAMADHHAELQTWTKKLDAIGSTLTRRVVEGWGEVFQQLQEGHGERVRELNEALTGLAERSGTVQTQAADSMDEAARSLSDYFAEMQRGLTSLNEVLEKLGEQQIVIQQQPRRGWWFFGGKNRS